jgi:hypothetical protein
LPGSTFFMQCRRPDFGLGRGGMFERSDLVSAPKLDRRI